MRQGSMRSGGGYNRDMLRGTYDELRQMRGLRGSGMRGRSRTNVRPRFQDLHSIDDDDYD